LIILIKPCQHPYTQLMNHPHISLTNGMGISILLTILLTLGSILNIYLATQSIAKPAQAILMVVVSVAILGGIYTSFPRWTTIQVPNPHTIIWTSKTLYGSKIKHYENITQIKLHHPKGGYALRIYQKGSEDYAFKGGWGSKEAQAMVDLFRKAGLPLETEYFQEK